MLHVLEVVAEFMQLDVTLNVDSERAVIVREKSPACLLKQLVDFYTGFGFFLH